MYEERDEESEGDVIEIIGGSEYLIEKFLKSGQDIEVIITQMKPTGPLEDENTTRLNDNSEPPHKTELIILDASFNPPHNTHMKMIMNAIESSKVENKRRDLSVLLLFSVKNADKKNVAAKLFQRLDMMVLLMKDILRNKTAYDVNFHVALTRCARFVDKLNAISNYFPNVNAYNIIPEEHNRRKKNEGTSTISFIVGSDTLSRIFESRFYNDGKEYNEKIQNENVKKAIAKLIRNPLFLVKFITFERETEPCNAILDDAIKRGIINEIDKKIHFPILPSVGNDSSTKCRNAISNLNPDCPEVNLEILAQMVPRLVFRYIKEHRLYWEQDYIEE